MSFKTFIISQLAAIAACSTLLSGGTIIAFDQSANELRVIRGGSLLIEGNQIASISDNPLPSNLSAQVEVIDCTDKIVTPGFIDTHRHGWQTVFKTLGSNTTLAEYIGRYAPLASEPLCTVEDIYISQLAGIYEALAAGVTTILDHAHHTWTPEHVAAGAKASADSGARVFFAYTFQNASEDFGVPEQFKHWHELASTLPGNLTQLSVAYDGWSGNPDGAETKAVIDFVQENNVPVLTTHSVEGPWLFGNSPQELHRIGILNSSVPIVISHASYIDSRGAALLRSTNKHVSITPESEMHYGHLNPTNHLVMDRSALGVDTHFTFSSDILTQARLWLQATRHRVFQNTIDRWEIPSTNPFSVNQAFLLATRNGGLALGREDLGVLAPGAKADIVVWDGRSPALLGWADPVAAIILHASVGDIEHVFVDGKFQKRNGKLVADDYHNVQDRFLASARRIQNILKNTPLPAQEGNFATGSPFGPVLQMDVQRGDGTGYGPSFV
ncbi:5-methylthioadenosine/S-adenosylhomocysteine deaminase [Paramyrothecium foliicola]|nr:5-methylthioadenosine/S-adenosylhomocysteine deaminase [Paramyrothecium foliicola]